MKIENRIAIEPDVLGRADEKRDGILMVEYHLGFELLAAFRLLAKLDEAPRVEQRVSVSFEPA